MTAVRPPGSTGSTGSTGGARSTGGIDGILKAGQLAGLSPAALAESFGTPFYVYDLDLIGRRVDALAVRRNGVLCEVPRGDARDPRRGRQE